MSIETTCPRCKHVLRVPDGVAGRRCVCAHCGAEVKVEAEPENPPSFLKPAPPTGVAEQAAAPVLESPRYADIPPVRRSSAQSGVGCTIFLSALGVTCVAGIALYQRKYPTNYPPTMEGDFVVIFSILGLMVVATVSLVRTAVWLVGVPPHQEALVRNSIRSCLIALLFLGLIVSSLILLAAACTALVLP